MLYSRRYMEKTDKTKKEHGLHPVIKGEYFEMYKPVPIGEWKSLYEYFLTRGRHWNNFWKREGRVLFFDEGREYGVHSYHTISEEATNVHKENH